jgi:predicted ATP-grasp superfamily ATP-dependent carboligase
MAGYNGTLAAVRSLARSGIGVLVADDSLSSPARWSSLVKKTLRCPPVEADPEAFLRWLIELGEKEPGRVLYPSGDDTAWLFARHRSQLERHYRLPMPEYDAVYGVLNKRLLFKVCAEVGLDAPKTWVAKSPADLEHIAAEADFPLVLKPQTQALMRPHQKGRVVHRASQLEPAWHSLLHDTRFAPMVLHADRTVSAPLVQQLAAGDGTIYNLSGFAGDGDGVFLVEASRKVLQWPKSLGVGLCFEEAAVVPELARKVEALCRRAGYFGAFEVEFVESAGKHLLIDFNPRFFGQMAFDLARGLDLPKLVYWGATENRAAYHAAIDQGRRATGVTARRAWCNRIELELSLPLFRLAGRIGGSEHGQWREWLRRNKGNLFDPVLDNSDWLPGLIEAAGAFGRRMIHPRSTWRSATQG